MALVHYSDSESDTDDNEDLSTSRAAKRIHLDTPTDNKQASSLPPLPPSFHDLYASSTRVSVRDDPSLHGGRKRVIPHVEGNWPTHIYLEWYPSKSDLVVLSDIITQAEECYGSEGDIHSLLHSDLGAQLPLHISLSRPVVLRTEQRDSFAEIFAREIRDSHIRPFDVTLYDLDWVSNYEKTRWFLVLRVQTPKYDCLNRLLRISNRTLALFDQPPLYESPTSIESKVPGRKHYADERPVEDCSHCFHISLAWTLTQPSSAAKARVANIDLRRLRDFTVHFNTVKAKIGNNVSSIPLSMGIQDERTIGGL
ncbi:hypothetical protein PHISCL_04314 [Aspergillus sclerotialis]|uniref:U6 snRNA phosphodiesterase n=1 Tax=Aspergillus sclerotialis TaxID=2070753 RepID=A0A3A2ZJH4_9EURO|nr:hypothetical protein PHISCL_04314 [Aspergillus sclerotialis]